MLLPVAYVSGLVAMIVAGIRYPRWRWPLLVVGLFYVGLPVLALLALLFMFSQTSFG